MNKTNANMTMTMMGWLWHYEIGFQHHLPHNDDTEFLTVQCYLMGMLVWIVSMFATAAGPQAVAPGLGSSCESVAHGIGTGFGGATVDQTAMPGPSMMLTTITLTTATQQPKGDGGSNGGVVWGLGGTHATATATLSSWKKYYGGTGASASNNISNLAVWLLGGQVVSFYYNHVLLRATENLQAMTSWCGGCSG